MVATPRKHSVAGMQSTASPSCCHSLQQQQSPLASCPQLPVVPVKQLAVWSPLPWQAATSVVWLAWTR